MDNNTRKEVFFFFFFDLLVSLFLKKTKAGLINLDSYDPPTAFVECQDVRRERKRERITKKKKGRGRKREKEIMREKHHFTFSPQKRNLIYFFSDLLSSLHFSSLGSVAAEVRAGTRKLAAVTESRNPRTVTM